MAGDQLDIDASAQQGVALLSSRIPLLEAYVFRSHVEGRAREDSDIDIAAFSPAIDGMDREKKVRLMTEAERQLDPRVELHPFGAKSLAEARRTNFPEYIRENGKRVTVSSSVASS